MGTLKDEAYDKLDYLSQLTEVVISPHNEILAKIPDRIELDFLMLNASKQNSWHANTGFVVDQTTVLRTLVKMADYEYITDIEKYFEFELSEDFEVNFVTKSLVGTATLVKKVQQIDERVLLELAVDKANQHLSYYGWHSKRLKEKVATVLNTFEPNRGTTWLQNLEGRVTGQAGTAVREIVSEMILENKWRIRDASVIMKMGEWINHYLSDETETSVGLVNLIKLKMMLDKDKPVYSVDEVINANPF